VPLGSERSASVPLLNIWTLGWNGEKFLNLYQGYWDAPIFYPVKGALAFSDPQPLGGPLAALIWPLSPALTYNLILLTYLAMNGLAAYWLVRETGLTVSAAILGGLIIEALPFITHERGVLQLNALFGPLMALAAYVRLSREPSVKHTLLFSLALLLTFLSSEYYALGLALPLTLLLLINPLQTSRRRPATLALAGATLAIIIAAPLAIGQARRLKAMGFSRSAGTLLSTSAIPADYLRKSDRLVSTHPAADPPAASGQPLSPGYTLTLLALPGMALGLGRSQRRRWVVFLILMTGTMSLMALGSNLVIGGVRPLEQLFQQTPILNWTRSPYRFAIFVQMGVALLGMEFFDWLLPRSRTALLIIGLITLLELYPRPETLTDVPGSPEWASLLPAESGLSAVHLPLAGGRTASDFENTAQWMVDSLQANVAMANGYSGYFPQIHRQMRMLMSRFPSTAVCRVLQAQGIDLVILHGAVDHETGTGIFELIDAGTLTEVGRTEDVWILRLAPGETHPASEFHGKWSARDASTEGRVVLDVHAEVPGRDIYLYLPFSTPLKWLLVERSSTGLRLVQVSPQRSGLIYHGADAWLQISTDWIPPTGAATYEIYQLDDGRLIASNDRQAFDVRGPPEP
jgi:hypothetical protein